MQFLKGLDRVRFGHFIMEVCGNIDGLKGRALNANPRRTYRGGEEKLTE